MGVVLLQPYRHAAPVAFPSDIIGLAARFKANSEAYADNAAVASATDLSGNARHATQATGAKQPKLRTNIINGRSVYRFDGGDTLRTAAFTLNQPNTILLVASSSVAPKYYLDGRSLNTRVVQNFSATTHRLYAGALLDKTGVASQVSPFISVVRFNGASSSIHFSGGAALTGNAGTSTGSGVAIGAAGDDTQGYMTGDIAEVAAWNTALSLADINRVGSYAAFEYGLAWTTAT